MIKKILVMSIKGYVISSFQICSFCFVQDFYAWILQNVNVTITNSPLVESIKTTSMEDVSTEVLEKNKEYLRR